MGKFFIKPYAFVDFINKNWDHWKDKKMIEASCHLLEMAAFAENQTKMPIHWDKEDWKFLLQFPPFLWTQAMTWRYNTGLIEASKLREEDPDKSINAIPDTRSELVLSGRQKKYIFTNVHTGFRTLVERLEKPIKNYRGHVVPGLPNDDSHGIRDINPFETDPNHPEHPSNYKHGLMDYDITNPKFVSDEMIDSMDVPEIKKKQMKKVKQHSFAGMGVLQPGTASTQMNTWLYAQGVGLLGDAPSEIKDPYTGEALNITKGTPNSINNQWAAATGKDDTIPLTVPIIKRRLKYIEVNNKKEAKIHDGEVAMPILNPGTAVPRIILSAEQKQILKNRREQNDKRRKTTGAASSQVGSVYNLLQNWDILTPEQKEHMSKNKRSLLHIASGKFGKLSPKHGDLVDKYSFSKDHYTVGGFQPNKGGRPQAALPKEKKEEIITKYYPMVLWGAEKYPDGPIKTGTYANLDKFMRWAKKEKLPKSVLEMMEAIKVSLAQISAALITLDINNLDGGVYDPDLELTGVDPSKSNKELEDERYSKTFNLAHDLSQKGLMGLASRRARQKGITVAQASLDMETGEEGGGSLKNAIAVGNVASDNGGTQWNTQRGQLDPLPQTGEVSDLSNLTWKVPEVKHEISKFFLTQRARIDKHANNLLSGVADQAINNVNQTINQASEKINQRREKYSPEMQATEDEYMDEFFTKIIAGQHWPFPVYNQEEEDFFPGPKRGLDDMKNLDAKSIVNFIKSVWTTKGAAKFAVPLLMAVSKMDEKTAIDQVKATGLTPDQKSIEQPQTIPMPIATTQKPAIAATDLTGMLTALPNNPSLITQLQHKEAELLKPENRQALKTAVEAVRKEFTQRYHANNLSSDFMHTYNFMNHLLSKAQ